MLNTSLSFVHTARRSYRLDKLVSSAFWFTISGIVVLLMGYIYVSRERKNRNKFSVVEPSEGSVYIDLVGVLC